MKKWVSLGIILILIVLCSFYGMGVGTEKVLKRNITILNQSNDISVVLRHYQRGWFRSHADLQWTVQIPQSPSEQALHRTVLTQKKAYTFELPLDIYHGPLIWGNSRFYLGLGYAHACAYLPDSVQQELIKAYQYDSAKFEYAINVLVNYLNKTTIQFVVPQYRMQAKEGDNYFQWLGMVTGVVVSSDKQHLQGDLDLKGFSWKNKDIKGLLGPVQGEYDMHQALDTLYIGKAQLTMPSLALFLKDQPVFRINDVEIHSNSDIQEGLFNSSFYAKLGQMTIENKVYSHNVFDLSFQNLDASVLDIMNRKLSELQLSSNDKQRIFWALIPDLPALLSKGAQLNLENFEVNLLADHVKMDLSLSLPKQNFTNPLQIIQKITGESHLKISQSLLSQWVQKMMKKAMVEQAQNQALTKEKQEPIVPPMAAAQNKPTLPSMTNVENNKLAESQLSAKVSARLKEWTDEGVLVQEGTDYLILLKLMDGKLFINGHPFNPAFMAF